jgi:hypothetical protein
MLLQRRVGRESRSSHSGHRARWTGEESGDTAEWWVLARSWLHETDYTLALGDVGCAGRRTLDPDDLRAGGHLELTAVRLDGSEVPIAGLPDRISTGLSPASKRALFIVFGLIGCVLTAIHIAWHARAKTDR